MRRLHKSDKLDPPIVVTYPKGCSRREPGMTPKKDVTMTFSSIDELTTLCGKSRQYAGVHFDASVEAGKKLCGQVGAKCYEKYLSMLG